MPGVSVFFDFFSVKINKAQIWLFCSIDKCIVLCYSLFVSRFFSYLKFLNQRKLISVTSEEFLLIYPIKYNRAGDDEGQSVCSTYCSCLFSCECERRTRMAKRYEELTISDDFMFGKAMGDKVASRSGWICIRGIKSVCTMQRCRI